MEAMNCVRLALTSVLALTSFSFPQEGSIVGTIVDAGGNLVTGATAYARPVGRIHVGITPHASTNANGEFVIAKLGFGKYSLGAAKPEEDYPELYFAFYTGFAAKFPIVTLSAQHRSASIIVRLGKKAGILKGTVTDAATGRPLNANVEFRRVLEPKNFMSGSGLTNAQFRILVPSDTPITMVVSLDGYENWRYEGADGGRKNAILLRPKEEMQMDIQLTPKQSTAGKPQ
jgi:hypothetical protein